MLSKLNKRFDLKSIIEQVQALNFEKSLELNYTDGKFLSGPYVIKNEFIGTPLGDVLEQIGPLGQARLLKLNSAESYTAHADPDDRIHLAIITNPNAYIIDLDNNKMYHLPADGELWYMNTGITHVAANFGGRTRIHLNIRVPLPRFQTPGYRLSVSGGEFDWKQETYSTLMTFFNRAIKNKIITGFEKINEREVLLNCDHAALKPYIEELKSKGLTVTLEAS